MNCEHFEHMLVERAEGLLDEHGASRLGAHLATCESCRRAAVEFGDVAERLGAAGGAFARTPLHVALDGAPVVTPPITTPQVVHGAGRGRRAPGSRRVLRWAAPLAGAATVAAAVLIPLAFDRTAGSAEAAVGLTAMNRALEAAHTLSCEVVFIPDEGDAQSGRLTIVRALRLRLDMPDGRVILSDASTGRTQIRLPDEQTFIEIPQREAAPVNLYERLVSLADNPSEDLGIEVISGIPARVFLVRGGAGDLGGGEYKVWINPHTSLPMKVEMPGRLGEDGSGAVASGRLELGEFIFGAEVDVGLVTLEAPPGHVQVSITADPRAARAEASAAARNIMMGLVIRHADTGEWPASLRTLVDAGVLTPERIRNPKAPEGGADAPPVEFGWIYVRPPLGDVNPQRLVVTEPAPEPWSGVIVAFADGHVEVVNDRERYERLLAEARAEP